MVHLYMAMFDSQRVEIQQELLIGSIKSLGQGGKLCKQTTSLKQPFRRCKEIFLLLWNNWGIAHHTPGQIFRIRCGNSKGCFVNARSPRAPRSWQAFHQAKQILDFHTGEGTSKPQLKLVPSFGTFQCLAWDNHQSVGLELQKRTKTEE